MKVSAALIAAAVIAALAPVSAVTVERWYSNGIFPRVQPFLTSVSNVSSIAFLDLLILAAVVLVGAALFRRLRARRAGRPASTWLRFALHGLAAAAALYLLFLMDWGFNYRRVPLIQRVRFDAARLSVDRARALASQTIVRLNALYERAHTGQSPASSTFDQELAEAFYDAAGQFGVAFRPVLPRPKWSLLDGYFRRAGVAGMTDPFFLEALIASDLLPVERPFVIAHEWSHVAGLADEGEANFAGWLICLRGTALHQYSGWLFAYSELVGSLDPRDRRAVAAQLAPGPRADLAAIRERLQRQVDPRLSAAGWRVYDRYLKANGVSSGAASYSEVVRLMLGADAAVFSIARPMDNDQPIARTPIAAVGSEIRWSPR